MCPLCDPEPCHDRAGSCGPLSESVPQRRPEPNTPSQDDLRLFLCRLCRAQNFAYQPPVPFVLCAIFGHNRLTVDTTLCQFILSFTLAGPGSHLRCGGTQSRKHRSGRQRSESSTCRPILKHPPPRTPCIPRVDKVKPQIHGIFIAPSLPLRGDQAVKAHTTRAPAPPFPTGRGA